MTPRTTIDHARWCARGWCTPRPLEVEQLSSATLLPADRAPDRQSWAGRQLAAPALFMTGWPTAPLPTACHVPDSTVWSGYLRHSTAPARARSVLLADHDDILTSCATASDHVEGTLNAHLPTPRPVGPKVPPASSRPGWYRDLGEEPATQLLARWTRFTAPSVFCLKHDSRNLPTSAVPSPTLLAGREATGGVPAAQPRFDRGSGSSRRAQVWVGAGRIRRPAAGFVSRDDRMLPEGSYVCHGTFGCSPHSPDQARERP